MSPGPPLATPGLAAVVLAGGASRRFGSDKLSARVGGASLLDQALDGLGPDLMLIVVGPERPLPRTAHFVREQPEGGGPAAGMVTGVRAALAAGAEEVVVLPGDAPGAGRTATLLLEVLRGAPHEAAVVGTDVTGFDQPLQLALTRAAAEQLVSAGGADGARGASARGLVNRLDPPALRWRLTAQQHWDVDTVEQLQAWQERDSPAVSSILSAVDALLARRDAAPQPGAGAPDAVPVVVALDGAESATAALASAVALRRPATVLRIDSFVETRGRHSPGVDRGDRASDATTGASADASVVDWPRLRAEALDPERTPGLVVVVGSCSGGPELADVVDLAVYVHDSRDRRAAGYDVARARRATEFDLEVWSGQG